MYNNVEQKTEFHCTQLFYASVSQLVGRGDVLIGFWLSFFSGIILVAKTLLLWFI